MEREFIYTPKKIDQPNNAIIASSFVRNGQFYYSQQCIGDSNLHDITLYQYDIPLGYEPIQTLNVNRDFLPENNQYYTSCIGGNGYHTNYTNDWLYAIGVEKPLIATIISIIVIISVPLWFINKWWRRT